MKPMTRGEWFIIFFAGLVLSVVGFGLDEATLFFLGLYSQVIGFMKFRLAGRGKK